MIECPKCSSNSVSGPLYFKGPYGEYLIYRCRTCGYEENTPTHDKSNFEMPIEKKSSSDMER